MLWIILGIVALAGLVAAGYSRVSLARKPGVEGILDSAAVESYDRLSWSPQYRYIQPRVVAELKRHDPKGTLVNIGCGPGYLDAVLVRELPGLRIIAVDIGAAMLRAARRNLTSQGPADPVSFQQTDVHSLPFADATVDVVVSALSLHHWRHAERAMGEIRRVLKPDGQFLLFDLRRDTRRWFYWALWLLEVGVISRSLRKVDAPLDSLRASYTPAEMGELLTRGVWGQWRVRGGAGWMVVWGCKAKP